MRLKRILALITASALLLWAVGCSPTASSSADNIPPSKPYEGVTLTVSCWKDPWESRYPFIWDLLEDEYGFKLEWKHTAQRKHITEISSLIASDQPIDIIYTDGYIPYAFSVLQPLENSGMNLDEFDNQAILKASSVNGKPYLAAGMVFSYGYFDVCVYNKSLFKQADIPTPKDLYEKGEWTLENFIWCAEKIADLGKEYSGAGILSESSIALSGDPFFKLNNGRVELGSGERLIDIMKVFSEMALNGSAKLDRSGFSFGRQGMALTTTFGLKRTGYFTSINPDHIGVTLYPKLIKEDEHTVSAPLSGWGIVKGSENPEAAGVFLKEYLNPSDEIIQSEDNYVYEFYSEELAEFYYEIYDKYNDEFAYYIASDVVNSTQKGEHFHEKWSTLAPDEIDAYIGSNAELMSQMRDTANNQITD